MSAMSCTGIRVPAKHGVPPMISGSVATIAFASARSCKPSCSSASISSTSTVTARSRTGFLRPFTTAQTPPPRPARRGSLADRFARLLEYAQDRSPARGRRQHVSRDIGELQCDESETVDQSGSPPGLDRPLEETGIDDPMHLLQWNAGRSRRLVGRERPGLEHDSPVKLSKFVEDI